MRVHPAPPPRHHRRKDLRRLPHIFAKVLELPIHSSADVTIHETSNSFKFIVSTTDISGEISADIIEIYPGVKKVVIRGYEESQIDMWRYRLPEDTRVEMASAVYGDGELVVTVPKEMEMERGGFEARSASGRLVLMQMNGFNI